MKKNAQLWYLAALMMILSACGDKPSNNSGSNTNITPTATDKPLQADKTTNSNIDTPSQPNQISHQIARCRVTLYDRLGTVQRITYNAFEYDSRDRLTQVIINDTPRINYTYYGDSIVETNATKSPNTYIIDKRGYLLRDRIGGDSRTDEFEYDKDGYAQKWITATYTVGGKAIMPYTVIHRWENGNMVSSASVQKGIISTSYDYYPDLAYQPMAPLPYKQGRDMKNLARGISTTYKGTQSAKVMKYAFDKQGRISQYTISQTDDSKAVYQLEYAQSK